ncbi:MAG: M23 family metallopeptidase [Candidatus Nitrohelix vancouverensis]|uniref:M23 family metallopeptidase n=1 Tax=Candidatus Nitrohelix vancouverensis TaxID=2705534 RepID=A0A7T0C0N1_9BACT|nr:MAG: M23 family metallopeptidase [Candidatus Nitrohelix vancouverensis]
MSYSEEKGDVNSPSNSAKRFLWSRQFWGAGIVLSSVLAIGAWTHFPAETPPRSVKIIQPVKLDTTPLPALTVPEPEIEAVVEAEVEAPPSNLHFKGTVARNESLTQLLGRKGVSLETSLKLARQTRSVYNWNRLRSGKSYSIEMTNDKELVSFVYQVDNNLKLSVERDGEEFNARFIETQYDIQLEVLEGRIQDNLISAVLDAGGNYQTALDLEEIFAWQINFFKDLRKGDSFKIIVEKKMRDNQAAGFGRIRAATFFNKGESMAAVYFEPDGGIGGYYAPDSRPLKKQFLKSPLKYTRITSGFTGKRFHPIYKKHLPHRAVDYAAPRGTPIYAISDGEVMSVSRNSRSGKHIKLKHRNGFVSSYSHLSRYQTGLSVGKKVQQGQVIGYVGSTGAATGPHLCFHLRKNGKSINPLTFQSPGGPPLDEENMTAFQLTARQGMLVLGYPEPTTT